MRKFLKSTPTVCFARRLNRVGIGCVCAMVISGCRSKAIENQKFIHEAREDIATIGNAVLSEEDIKTETNFKKVFPVGKVFRVTDLFKDLDINFSDKGYVLHDRDRNEYWISSVGRDLRIWSSGLNGVNEQGKGDDIEFQVREAENYIDYHQINPPP